MNSGKPFLLVLPLCMQCFAADPLDTWTIRNPKPSYEVAHSVAFGNGRWVAAGYYGLTLLSTNGATWTPQRPAGSRFENFLNVSFAKDRFFLSTISRYYFTSIDGISWTPGELPNLDQFTPVFDARFAYLNDRFVAFGYDAAIFTSTDGQTWSEKYSSPGSVMLLDAEFGNGTYLIVGSQTMVSSDGESWQALASEQVKNLAFGNGLFVASTRPTRSAYFRQIVSSSDGVNWIPQQTLTNEIFDIEFLNGNFWAVTERGEIFQSIDAADWIPKAVISDVDPADLSLSPSGMVIVGRTTYPGFISSAAFFSSPDGENWTRRDSGLHGLLDDITFGGGQFVAVGSLFSTRAYVYTSPDGINWTDRSPATTNRFRRIAYGNGLYVATAFDNSSSAPSPSPIFTSPDAIQWTKGQADNIRVVLQSVIYAANTFVAVGVSNTIARSTDGVTWTTGSFSKDAEPLYSVAYGNGTFVAVGARSSSATPIGDNILSSADAVSWTRRDTGFNTGLRAVAFGNGRFVAVESPFTNVIKSFTSSNGIDWTRNEFTLPVPQEFDSRAEKIIFAAGRFVLVARTQAGYTYSSVFSSSNGQQWLQHGTYSPQYLWSAAYGNNSVVVVADRGILLQSNAFPAEAFLKSALVPGAGFRINLSGANPTDYRLQRTASLPGPWEILGHFDAEGNFLDPFSNPGVFIYRAISP